MIFYYYFHEICYQIVKQIRSICLEKKFQKESRKNYSISCAFLLKFLANREVAWSKKKTQSQGDNTNETSTLIFSNTIHFEHKNDISKMQFFLQNTIKIQKFCHSGMLRWFDFGFYKWLEMNQNFVYKIPSTHLWLVLVHFYYEFYAYLYNSCISRL